MKYSSALEIVRERKREREGEERERERERETLEIVNRYDDHCTIKYNGKFHYQRNKNTHTQTH